MSTDFRTAVREQYGRIADSALSGDDAGVRQVAEAFGYTAGELDSIPAGANLGLSCGNPTAMASLRPGEVVVDLGSGGGLDVFLAAKKVGPTGRAVGIDMTPAMIDRSRANAATGGYDNVAFHLAPIDASPLADASVDCIISNCVINLASDKPAVFREMFRVLKPRGRVAVSDIALKRALPPEIERSVAAYVGCIAGAIPIEDYVRGLREAGFEAVHVVDAGSDLNAYGHVEGQSACCSPAMEKKTSPTVPAASCCGTAADTAVSCCRTTKPGADASPGVHEGLAKLIQSINVNDYAASVKVYAVKPVGKLD